nr:group II truncated hemoglobin [Saliniradius amylolyticus]
MKRLKKLTSRLTQSSTEAKPKSLYDIIGGEGVTRQLCETFYDVMENDPNAAELLAIHQEDMSLTRQKFFEFMSGWLGGPQLFVEKYGHPRLRARHLHVAIDDTMVTQWLYCMQRALKQTLPERQHQELIWSNIQPLAWHMKNQDSGSSDSQSRG